MAPVLKRSVLALAILFLFLFSTTSSVLAKQEDISRRQIQENFGKVPLSFEVNKGQVNPSIEFLSRGSGYSLFLTPTDGWASARFPSCGIGLGLHRLSPGTRSAAECHPSMSLTNLPDLPRAPAARDLARPQRLAATPSAPRMSLKILPTDHRIPRASARPGPSRTGEIAPTPVPALPL